MFLVALLIMALLLVALPLPVAMTGMGWCPGCLGGNVAYGFGLCLAILAAAVLILVLSSLWQRSAPETIFKGILLSFLLLRPPRSATQEL